MQTQTVTKNDIIIHSDWKKELENSITSGKQLETYMDIQAGEVDLVTQKYPMKITPYYLSLVLRHGAPLARQAIPDILEMQDNFFTADPLMESPMSPVPNLIHRYPDRVVLLISKYCATYCRHCMRKRMVGTKDSTSFEIRERIESFASYISKHKNIRDIILSGGDPLLLEDDDILFALKKLRKIKHAEIIRIHTRVPCTLPQRITPRLVDIFKKYHPLYINIQFNHPKEITPSSAQACIDLAEAGIPLGSQTVLLKGINDTSETIKKLMKALIKIRIRPYYLHHPDPVKGVSHMRPSLQQGMAIMKSLRGHISGMCVPQYMIDLPGGGGKIPLLPEYIKKIEGNTYTVCNYNNEIFKYNGG